MTYSSRSFWKGSGFGAKRVRVSILVRELISKALSELPFISYLDPDMISGSSLILSVLVSICLSRRMLIPSFLLLSAVLLLDAVDGVVARRKGLSSENGWIVDVSVDRISEAIISLALSTYFALLVVLNIAISFCNLKERQDFVLPILPLRIILLFAVLLYLLIPYEPLRLAIEELLL